MIKNFDKREVWGPVLWGAIDRLAREFPENPTEADIEPTFYKLHYIINQIPCSKCRDHAKDYLKYQINMESRLAFQQWVWIFHDSVNKRRESEGYKTSPISFKSYLRKQSLLSTNGKPGGRPINV
jgi:hypothetical protein